MRFKDGFIYQAKMAEGFKMVPFFAACDACGESFTSAAFGGRGNTNDTWVYELCAWCVERLTALQATDPDGAELGALVERVRQALQLRYAPPGGSA
jgi:hypothetical protein